jgi:hypothetical protein
MRLARIKGATDGSTRALDHDECPGASRSFTGANETSMSLACQDLYKIYPVQGIYRLPGSVKLDLNYNIIDGFVQHYPGTPNGSWSKSDVPSGISVFASLIPEDLDHEAFSPAEPHSLLSRCLRSPFRMVYCNVLKLMLESADALMAEVHHFQIYVNDSGISEETFVGIVRDSTELFSWLPCHRIGDIRLCPALPPFDSPYGFDGHRGVRLLFHFNNWYEYCDLEDVNHPPAYKRPLYLDEKSETCREGASRSNLVLYLLGSGPAGCEDDIFHYLLEDAKETLKEEVALCNLPLFSVLLIAHPRDCAMEDSLFEVNEDSLDSIQWSTAAVLAAAYSVPDTFTVGIYCVQGQSLFILVETAVPINEMLTLSSANFLRCDFTISEIVSYPISEEDEEMRHAIVNS